ncbi:MAG: DUF2232 domain-containing protein [Elusimicrobia bacterium]|nr:DUF2232 domain-containing protein [Elusimicrobiota bacterium]
MSAIKKIFLFASFSFLFFMSGFAIPFTGIFFLPLSSVSLVLLFVKSGVLSGLIGIIISTAAIYKFISHGAVLSFAFLLFVVLNSLFLYSGIKSKKSCWRIIADSCTAISSVSVAVILSFVIYGFQISWINLKIAADIPKDIAAAFVEIITRNIYSITVIFVIIMVTLSYIFLSAVSNRFNLKIKKLQPFEKWRLPEKFVLAFIFSLLFYIVFKQTQLTGAVGQVKSAVLFQISENIRNLIFFLYFVGGLSIGKFFFSKSKVILVLSYIVFILYPPSAVFLGVSDVWLDFRRKKGEKNDEDGCKQIQTD